MSIDPRGSLQPSIGPAGPLRVLVAAYDQNTAIRHGGVRRSHQMSRLSRADVTLAVPNIRAVPRKEAMRCAAVGLGHVWNAGLPLVSTLRAAFAVGYLRLRLSELGVAWRSAAFHVEFSKGPVVYVAYWMAINGIAFSASPQNMEFLVPHDDAKARDDGAHYRMERLIYGRARRVLCISDLDAHIVRCLGGTAATVAYFPVDEDAARCRAIRGARIESSGSFKLLFVGTVHNPPTLVGLLRLMQAFEQSFDERWTLHVVGYGTQAAASAGSRRMIVEGSVSDVRLDALLSQSAAVLLNQPATTGFMTRLVEFNLSGVPTFVNEDYRAASGLERYGIHTYRELGEVAGMLSERGGAQAFSLFEPPSQIEEERMRNLIWST